MINFAIGIDIAGSAIFLVLIIIGAVKAWPYRKTDRERFNSVYKPYKWAGFGIWIGASIICTVMLLFAQQ
ncbi:MAG: hypothetical protein NC418_05615 [Muribaculaceae bacterium]|nr:hypothetical protein [Muribaculaceae bacterium]